MAEKIPNTNMERKLTAMTQLENRKEHLAREKHLTITLSRKFGCEGYVLAEKLKEILEEVSGEKWEVYDKKLIEDISLYSDIPEEFLRNLGDSSQVLDKLSMFVPNMQTHEEAYKVVKEYIQKIAKKGNAIIVGRGAEYITQEMKNCYQFRLDAPQEHRINYIQETCDLEHAEAEKMVKANERIREEFIEKSLGVRTQDDYALYHAIYNTSKESINNIAESIGHYVGLKITEGREFHEVNEPDKDKDAA